MKFLIDSIRFDSIRFITNLYYDILQEAASIVGVDIQDKVEIINLGEISNINRGASPRPIKSFISNEIENSVPWIKIGDTKLESKYIVDTKERITKEGAKKSRVLKKGSFILSNSMSYGRPYILSIDGAIHDGWASINDFEQFLVSDYLYHYLITKRTQDYWQLKMNTASVSNLNSEIIRGLPILLPPLHVQQHVVNVLDKFDILVNDIKEGLPKEIEQRQKQYEYWRECLLNFPKQY
ncbi:MAG: restriction endonuclease subunit S [Gemella morbillorum]|uniref:restriction endonuclease subunit S n=1 Tax=Gemella morbillorum TaxID=29391 RepID=UPI001CB1C4FF|nr:restriction endonuclease subunit S [Gemella morbillorum]MBF1209902.1 restriction endonuclease subunit S [Gemella morbillorum]